MRAALEGHDRIVRGAIEARGGYVFTTAGDSFAAAFSGPEAAASAAAEMQRGLMSEGWPSGVAIAVRVGIHLGQAAERDGDYFGPTVNRAARLMSIAHGGQVVLSGETADRLSDVDLQDLGRHRLKDLSEPQAVLQLMSDGLPSEFPPLRSLDGARTNLPVVTTSLVGRSADENRVREALGSSRLVTVTGPGGVGKTRLVMQVGAELVDAFDGGVWIAELGAVEDDDDVAGVVAAAVRVRRRSGQDPAEALIEDLRARELLVVLDNCEHVATGAAAMAGRLWGSCPGVCVLATSRSALNISGESVVLLQPLPIDRAAVALFAERAHAADDRFRLGSDSIEPVRDLCAVLDGLPLAIELAAARTRVLSPDQIAARVTQDLSSLAARDPTAENRRRTLETVVAWSYDQLGVTAQQVFCEVSVIPVPFELVLAAALMDDRISDWSLEDAIVELVENSLLTRQPHPTFVRYAMLNTIRTYGRARLRESGSLQQVRDRFVRAWTDIVPTGIVL
jgi:predicted ATPase